MNLLRFRPVTRTVTIEVPGGSARKVKVTTNELGTVQQVEDGDVLHGHARPSPVALAVRVPTANRRSGLLRNRGEAKARQDYRHDTDTGLWAPVPGTERYV